MITDAEALVLVHTAYTGRYVTDEAHVIALGKAGLLLDHGLQPLAPGMHYFTMTGKGRTALEEWRAAQPKPKPGKRRRRSPAFAAWRTHCDVFSRLPFERFLREVWPDRKIL